MKPRKKNLHTRHFGIAFIALGLGLAGCIAYDADGNWHFSSPDLSSESGWIDELRDRIANHDATAAREFAMRNFEALHSTDPRDMDKLLSLITTVNEHAPSLPGIQAYASWIDSRMAYFEAAQAAKHITHTHPEIPLPHPTREPELRLPTQPQPTREPELRLPTQPRPTGSPPTPPPRRAAFDTQHSATPAALPQPAALATHAAPRTPTPSPTQATTTIAAAAGPDGRTGRAYWQQAVLKHRRPASADAMLPRIKPAFRANGLPEELVWIAEVESSMDPVAQSPVGARGLFQLMPRTAQSLGLKLSPQDQRLNPEHNAQAAAQYLRTLYKRFGSWPLTLAAYNAGEGRVAGLCRKHKTQRFDVIAANLPNETQMYVPRVLETIHLRTGINPDTLPAPSL